LANRVTVLHFCDCSSYEVINIFDPKKEAEKLKLQSKIKYQQRHGRSRLDRFSGQILGLKDEGCSAVEIQGWLRAKRIKVSLSTVTRWLKKHG